MEGLIFGILRYSRITLFRCCMTRMLHSFVLSSLDFSFNLNKLMTPRRSNHFILLVAVKKDQLQALEKLFSIFT